MGIMKVGTPITLELYKRSQNEPERYKCKLVDKEKNFIYIDYPVKMDSGKTGFFFEGTEFYASFVGEDSSVYRFETEVVARKLVNIPVLVLTSPDIDHLERIQRRKYVRVDASVDTAIQTGDKPMNSFTTVTQDISGGGAAIIPSGRHSLLPGQVLNVTLVLAMSSGQYRYIETKGKVIRVGASKGRQNSVSIEFINISEKHRQAIIQYCYEQQMYMKRRKVN